MITFKLGIPSSFTGNRKTVSSGVSLASEEIYTVPEGKVAEILSAQLSVFESSGAANTISFLYNVYPRQNTDSYFARGDFQRSLSADESQTFGSRVIGFKDLILPPRSVLQIAYQSNGSATLTLNFNVALYDVSQDYQPVS